MNFLLKNRSEDDSLVCKGRPLQTAVPSRWHIPASQDSSSLPSIRSSVTGEHVRSFPSLEHSASLSCLSLSSGWMMEHSLYLSSPLPVYLFILSGNLCIPSLLCLSVSLSLHPSIHSLSPFPCVHHTHHQFVLLQPYMRYLALCQ